MIRTTCIFVTLTLGACGSGPKADTEEPAPTATTSAPAAAAAPEQPSEPATESPADEPADAPPTAEVEPGEWDFTLVDVDGNEVSLADFRGKTVVLEWFNPECPFIKYAHGEGPLADLEGSEADEDVVWLAINSNAPGEQGHGRDLNAEARDAFGIEYPVLLDESGEVGKKFGAKTTPHMFVLDADAELVYRGALDNAPLGRTKGDEYRGYVDEAVEALELGNEVPTARTKPYGCSVKYSN